MNFDVVFSIIIKMFFTDCFYIIWAITAFYISKIKKYKYDSESSSATDRLKFWWVMLIYGSIAFSCILINEVFEKNTTKIILFVLISIVIVMVSVVLLLRFINKKPGRQKFFSKFKMWNITYTRKAIIITNIMVALYSLAFSLFLEFE